MGSESTYVLPEMTRKAIYREILKPGTFVKQNKCWHLSLVVSFYSLLPISLCEETQLPQHRLDQHHELRQNHPHKGLLSLISQLSSLTKLIIECTGFQPGCYATCLPAKLRLQEEQTHLFVWVLWVMMLLPLLHFDTSCISVLHAPQHGLQISFRTFIWAGGDVFGLEAERV